MRKKEKKLSFDELLTELSNPNKNENLKKSKSKPKIKFTESDLAEKIIEHLEKDNWISYKEVCITGVGGGSRSDSYFIKKNSEDVILETLSVETKLSLTLKVIEQAYNWLNYANRCYVCIPTPKRNARSSYWFGIQVCKKMNIGVFEVNMSTGIIKELYAPIIDKNTKIPPLYEQQRESIAGNNKGSFITSFKVTVMNIDSYMKDINTVELKDLISNIKHHYKTDKSATNTIRKFINDDIIKGYLIKKEDKKIIVYKK